MSSDVIDVILERGMRGEGLEKSMNVNENCYLCVMEKGLKLLRRMYPEREDFTDAEVEMVELALLVNAESGARSGMLPAKFVEVGDLVTVGGYVYRCVEAKRVTCPSDACLGCDFSRLYRNCSSVQCGCFDRRDHRFVWFKEVGDAK